MSDDHELNRFFPLNPERLPGALRRNHFILTGDTPHDADFPVLKGLITAFNLREVDIRDERVSITVPLADHLRESTRTPVEPYPDGMPVWLQSAAHWIARRATSEFLYQPEVRVSEDAGGGFRISFRVDDQAQDRNATAEFALTAHETLIHRAYDREARWEFSVHGLDDARLSAGHRDSSLFPGSPTRHLPLAQHGLALRDATSSIFGQPSTITFSKAPDAPVHAWSIAVSRPHDVDRADFRRFLEATALEIALGHSCMTLDYTLTDAPPQDAAARLATHLERMPQTVGLEPFAAAAPTPVPPDAIAQTIDAAALSDLIARTNVANLIFRDAPSNDDLPLLGAYTGRRMAAAYSTPQEVPAFIQLASRWIEQQIKSELGYDTTLEIRRAAETGKFTINIPVEAIHKDTAERIAYAAHVTALSADCDLRVPWTFTVNHLALPRLESGHRLGPLSPGLPLGKAELARLGLAVVDATQRMFGAPAIVRVSKSEGAGAHWTLTASPPNPTIDPDHFAAALKIVANELDPEFRSLRPFELKAGKATAQEREKAPETPALEPGLEGLRR